MFVKESDLNIDHYSARNNGPMWVGLLEVLCSPDSFREPRASARFWRFLNFFFNCCYLSQFFFSRRSVLKIFTARSSTHKPFILKTKTCRRCSVAKYTSSSSLKLAFCSICPFIDRVGPRLPGNKYDLTKIIAHKLQAHKPIIIIALDSYKNDKRPEN